MSTASGSPREVAGGDSGPTRGTTALLLAAAGLSLVPRLAYAMHRPLSHNGAWHLFAARFFRHELGTIAHPPLFLLLLKACDAVNRSLFSYRLIPLVAGAASVYLVGRLLDRMGCLVPTSLLGALTIAFSTTAVALSGQVEGFTLAVFFVLSAFFFALDLFPMTGTPPASSRTGFAVFASLALLTEYLSGLFLVAIALAPLAAAALLPDYRRRLRPGFPRRLGADALTLLPPAVVGAALYALLAGRWVGMLSGPASGLPRYYFHPGAETVRAFIRRTLTSTFDLFAPWKLPDSPACAALAAFVLLAIAAPATERLPETLRERRVLPALLLALLLAVGIALGLSGRYPFGGTHRHQILLLYFAVLAGAVAFDRLLRRAGPAAGAALAVAGAAAIAASALHNRGALLFRDEPMNVRAGIFAKNLAGLRGGVVHFDQLNFIGLFMDFYAWDCRFGGRISENPWEERYEFSRGERRFTAIYHRFRFLMDLRSPALYEDLRKTFPAAGRGCQTVFQVDRNLFTRPHTLRPEAEREDLQREIPARASAAGLDLRAITIDDDFVELVLCPRP
ncbi:MAG TPA: hypothetical protein VIA45_02460 [Thermoanaerobaculia bacterium]|jgi:hypothetical protein